MHADGGKAVNEGELSEIEVARRPIAISTNIFQFLNCSKSCDYV